MIFSIPARIFVGRVLKIPQSITIKGIKPFIPTTLGQNENKIFTSLLARRNKKNKNMIIDVHAHIGLLPNSKFAEGYEKNLDFLSAEMKEAKIDHAYVGSNKLMYGTDWPLCPMRSYVRFAKGLELNRADQEKLFYKNALKVFKLK